MVYNGPDPRMSYRNLDQLQQGSAVEIAPARYEREHGEEDDADHGVTWDIVNHTEAIDGYTITAALESGT